MAVTEQTFAAEDWLDDDEAPFDFGARCSDLRVYPTEWLEARLDDLTRQRRRLHVERLAVLKVLRERQVDEPGDVGESPRTSDRDRKTADRLERHPKLADAAHKGDISEDQLEPASQLADDDGDSEWANRAPNISPGDLKRMAAARKKPTRDDAKARREARSLSWWWNRDAGMLDGRFSLPDVDGALFENVLNTMIDRMKPAKSEAWDTRAHRGADALVELCRNVGSDDSNSGVQCTWVVEVPLHGPALVNGVPLADEQIEALRAKARIEPVLLDEHGAPIAFGRARSTLPPKIRRAVLLRDGHCRWPGCERRTGLEAHHMQPRCWGGTDDIANLVSACVGGSTDHHHQLVPHGDHWLIGNPNLPEGIRLIHRDDPEAPRAGPAP